jgi:hypothetical protein
MIYRLMVRDVGGFLLDKSRNLDESHPIIGHPVIGFCSPEIPGGQPPFP